MIPTKEQAWDLLCEYNEGEFHRLHARIVGDVMRYFAVQLGYADEADFWQTVGILHDLDFEQYPDQHCTKEAQILRERGVDAVLTPTFDDAEAFIRFPSSSDSTITPFVDCATYLYNPGCPDIAKISFNSINLQELSSYKIISSHQPSAANGARASTPRYFSEPSLSPESPGWSGSGSIGPGTTYSSKSEET